MTGDDLLATLPKLSESQLREIAARAAALAAGRGNKSDRTSASLIFEVLSAHTHARGCSSPPFGAIKRLPYYKAAMDGAEVVEKYAREHLGSKRRTTDLQIYHVLIRMLLRWMDEVQVPVTHKTVCQNLHRIPGLVERQFPGYAGAGLLGWILRSPARV